MNVSALRERDRNRARTFRGRVGGGIIARQNPCPDGPNCAGQVEITDIVADPKEVEPGAQFTVAVTLTNHADLINPFDPSLCTIGRNGQGLRTTVHVEGGWGESRSEVVCAQSVLGFTYDTIASVTLTAPATEGSYSVNVWAELADKSPPLETATQQIDILVTGGGGGGTPGDKARFINVDPFEIDSVVPPGDSVRAILEIDNTAGIVTPTDGDYCVGLCATRGFRIKGVAEIANEPVRVETVCVCAGGSKRIPLSFRAPDEPGSYAIDLVVSFGRTGEFIAEVPFTLTVDPNAPGGGGGECATNIDCGIGTICKGGECVECGIIDTIINGDQCGTSSDQIIVIGAVFLVLLVALAVVA